MAGEKGSVRSDAPWSPVEASRPLALSAFIFMHAGLTTLSSPFEELSFPTLPSFWMCSQLHRFTPTSPRGMWTQVGWSDSLVPWRRGPGWRAVFCPSWPWNRGDTWWMRVDDHPDLDAVWLCMQEWYSMQSQEEIVPETRGWIQVMWFSEGQFFILSLWSFSVTNLKAWGGIGKLQRTASSLTSSGMSCGMEFLGSFAIKTSYRNEVSECSFLQASNPALVDDVSLATVTTEGRLHDLVVQLLCCVWLFFFVKFIIIIIFCVWLFATPWTARHQASLSFTSPGICSNSCPLSRWCHPTISSSVIPFSSRLQSFPASGSFSMSWLFPSGGLSIGASASALILPENIQGWFPLGLNDLIPSNTTVQKHQFVGAQSSLWANLTSLQKNHSFD